MTQLDLVGSAEIATILDLTQQHVNHLATQSATFTELAAVRRSSG